MRIYDDQYIESLQHEARAVGQRAQEAHDAKELAEAKRDRLRAAYKIAEQDDVASAIMVELADSLEVVQRAQGKAEKLTKEFETLKQRIRRAQILRSWGKV